MKKIKITLAVVTGAMMLLFFTGCEKTFDRNQCIGDWDFVTHKSLYDEALYVYLSDTTIYYTGQISLGDTENELIIKYTENNEIIVKTTPKGDLYAPTTHSPPCPGVGPSPNGYFEGENKLHLTPDYRVGISHREDHNIIGTKKKGGTK